MAKAKRGKKFPILSGTAIIVVLAVALSVAIAVVSHVPPTSISTVSCGQVDAHLTPYSSNSAEVENCFYSSYIGKYNATMTMHYMGVDTGSTDNLSIVHGAGNTIIYDIASSFVNVGGTRTALYVCSSMAPYFNNSTKISGFLVSRCTDNYTVFIPGSQAV